MRHNSVLVLLAFLMSALPLRVVAEAAEGAQDLRQALADHGCIACHGEAEMRIGPPFDAIAQRYAAASEEQIYVLTRKVLAGGAGNWGVVPMNAQPHLTGADADRLVRGIIGPAASGRR